MQMMTFLVDTESARLSGQTLNGTPPDLFVYLPPATSALMAKNTTKVHKDVIKRASLSIL
jgi:hypothetical protein